jgi:hypothetical protein
MNHKKKAKELIEKFTKIEYLKDSEGNWKEKESTSLDIAIAKECTLIAVNEVLKAVSINQVLCLTDMTYQIHYDYTKVKKEIEKS